MQAPAKRPPPLLQPVTIVGAVSAKTLSQLRTRNAMTPAGDDTLCGGHIVCVERHSEHPASSCFVERRPLTPAIVRMCMLECARTEEEVSIVARMELPSSFDARKQIQSSVFSVRVHAIRLPKKRSSVAVWGLRIGREAAWTYWVAQRTLDVSLALACAWPHAFTGTLHFEMVQLGEVLWTGQTLEDYQGQPIAFVRVFPDAPQA